MNRAAAVPVIARWKASRTGALTALVRACGQGSVMAVLMTLSLVLLGEGAPGDLDPTFGVGGKVITDFSGDNDESAAVALQPDGKIVVAGHNRNFASGHAEFLLARYQSNGTLDTTFGGDGWTTTGFGSISALAQAVALQPDGKIVVAGYTIDESTGVAAFALARYHPDGTLDTTFGGDGRVTTDFVGSFGLVYAVVLQPDGKIVAAGGLVLARYHPDGTLDTTFGDDGLVIVDFNEVFAAALQPDGKIVAAGQTFNVATERYEFALARYLPNGTLDTTFGGDGRVTTDFVGFAIGVGLLIQPHDGCVVVAGSSNAIEQEGGFDFALARYESQLVVNAFVSFEPLPSTFHITPNPAGCPEGFAGKFSFEAQLTNISESSLTALVVGVTTLTNGNLLHNADGGPGGVGAQLTVPEEDGFADGVLKPEEFVEVLFVICLKQRRPFTFMVDVFGVVEASPDAQAMALP